MAVVLSLRHIHRHFARQHAWQSVDVQRMMVLHIDRYPRAINVSGSGGGRARNIRLHLQGSRVGTVVMQVDHLPKRVVAIPGIKLVRNLFVVVRKVPGNKKGSGKIFSKDSLNWKS